MSEDKQDEMLQALIDKMTPKLAEAVMGQINSTVDERLNGIAKKNDQLLGELVKQKDHSSDLASKLASAEKASNSGKFDAGAATSPVLLRKSDARSVAKYRAAKTEAEKRGVSLEIVADD